jgi:hypothetical protein
LYGDGLGYLRQVLGLSVADINDLRRLYLDWMSTKKADFEVFHFEISFLKL